MKKYVKRTISLLLALIILGSIAVLFTGCPSDVVCRYCGNNPFGDRVIVHNYSNDYYKLSVTVSIPNVGTYSGEATCAKDKYMVSVPLKLFINGIQYSATLYFLDNTTLSFKSIGSPNTHCKVSIFAGSYTKVTDLNDLYYHAA